MRAALGPGVLLARVVRSAKGQARASAGTVKLDCHVAGKLARLAMPVTDSVTRTRGGRGRLITGPSNGPPGACAGRAGYCWSYGADARRK